MLPVPAASPPLVAGCPPLQALRPLRAAHPCRRTKRVVEEAVSPALTLAMRAMYQSRVSLQADLLPYDVAAKLVVPLHTPSFSEQRGAGNAAAATRADKLVCCTWLGPAAVLRDLTAPALPPSLLYLPLDQAGKYLLRHGGGLKKLRQMTGG